MQALKLLLFSLLATFALAVRNWEAYGTEQATLYSCRNYIVHTVSFGKSTSNPLCSNPNALATLVGCYVELGKNNSKMYELPKFYCEHRYNQTLTDQNFTDAYNNLMQNGVPIAELKARNYNMTKESLKTPVFLDPAVVRHYYKAQAHFYEVYTNSTYYGIGTVGYWVLVCLVGAFANWSMILFPKLRFYFNGPISKFWRKQISLPAFILRKQAVPQKLGLFWFLVPSRLESIISIAFVLLLIGVNAAEMTYIPDDPIFDTKTLALLDYVGNRTAIVCTLLIPILLLFGGRNNFLMWLTRWKYSTFVTYHRWVGRWVVLMAFIHSICFTKYFILEDEYAEEMAETYLIWGVVATTCGCLIAFQGLLYLRRKWYESFLVIHILLAIFFVVGTWYHVIDLGFGQVMYAAFAVWAFDRVVKVIRLVSFGFPKAEVTLLQDRIEVIVPRPAHWKPIAGGYAWLHFGHRMYFWQSHPFTYVYDKNTITFYCAVHSGLTNLISKQLSISPGKSCAIRVGVEGPYGNSNPIKHHSDVVFFAGGNGIPGPLAEFKELQENSASKQRLTLNWILRDSVMFEEMSKHFAGLISSNAEINIYITRPVVGENLSMKESKEAELRKNESHSEETDRDSSLQLEYPTFNFFYVRPNLMSLVETSISECSNSVAFVGCGPAAMIDDLRQCVVQNIDKTQKRVDFYDNLEVWT